MTANVGKRARAVMMSSVMPSAKKPCSGSVDMFVNGNTAIEGLSKPATAASALLFVPLASAEARAPRCLSAGGGAATSI